MNLLRNYYDFFGKLWDCEMIYIIAISSRLAPVDNNINFLPGI